MPSGCEKMTAMLTLHLPTPAQLDHLVARESATGFTYPVGLTRGARPPRWFVEDVSAILGVGPDAFGAAGDALRRWEQMDLGWFSVHEPERVALEPGTVLACSSRILGAWWSYCCRIVEVFDERTDDGSRRLGFTYGTIGSHAARGEERFLVRMDGRTNEVHGEILAISRPSRWYSWLGLLPLRRAQRMFKPQALAALAGAVRRRLAATGQRSDGSSASS